MSQKFTTRQTIMLDDMERVLHVYGNDTGMCTGGFSISDWGVAQSLVKRGYIRIVGAGMCDECHCKNEDELEDHFFYRKGVEFTAEGLELCELDEDCET